MALARGGGRAPLLAHPSNATSLGAMPESDARLVATALDVSVPGRNLVCGLEIELAPGEFVAVLGQNGAGKTLTLHTLAGLRKPESGRVSLHGRDLDAWRRRELAKTLALLPQETEDVFPARVLETVLIGRHPHIHPLQVESAADHAIARRALETLSLSEFEMRDVATLSGGERRRLAIAQLLCQEPRFFLLDEPVNHLDPQHQLQVLELFRQLADDGAGVAATLHDVNLAARFCNRVLLLDGRGGWTLGDADEVLTEAHLSRLFGVAIETIPWRGRALFVASGRPGP